MCLICFSLKRLVIQLTLFLGIASSLVHTFRRPGVSGHAALACLGSAVWGWETVLLMCSYNVLKMWITTQHTFAILNRMGK